MQYCGQHWCYRILPNGISIEEGSVLLYTKFQIFGITLITEVFCDSRHILFCGPKAVWKRTSHVQGVLYLWFFWIAPGLWYLPLNFAKILIIPYKFLEKLAENFKDRFKNLWDYFRENLRKPFGNTSFEDPGNIRTRNFVVTTPKIRSPFYNLFPSRSPPLLRPSPARTLNPNSRTRSPLAHDSVRQPTPEPVTPLSRTPYQETSSHRQKILSSPYRKGRFSRRDSALLRSPEWRRIASARVRVSGKSAATPSEATL